MSTSKKRLFWLSGNEVRANGILKHAENRPKIIVVDWIMQDVLASTKLGLLYRYRVPNKKL